MTNKASGIVLTRKKRFQDRGPIRITREAYAALDRIKSKTGMSLANIASSIIVQAEAMIVFVDETVDDEEDEDE